MHSRQEDQPLASATIPVISSFSAVTLATHDMARVVDFYRTLGFVLRHGGAGCEFSTFGAGLQLSALHASKGIAAYFLAVKLLALPFWLALSR